nr:MAG TPA: hypothetical protein [Caudoviricetes sp.]
MKCVICLLMRGRCWLRPKKRNKHATWRVKNAVKT